MTSLSRRTFLKSSAAWAGLAALPLSRSVGAEGPNDRVRVAVVGLNGRGKAHVAAYAAIPGCEVAAVVDVDEAVGRDAADAIADATGRRPAVHVDMRRAFDDPAIDAVSLATPNHWHALGTIWAIQAGKDVYVEKPVSHNVVEGRRMTEAARKYDKVCQYGAQCRTIPGTRDMVSFVLGGGIGEVKLARGLCYKRRKSIGRSETPLAFPAGVDRDLWTGPAESTPIHRPERNSLGGKNPHYDWHWDFNTGNGDLGNQGIHQMDVCRWGLGVDGIGDSAIAYGGRLGYEDAGDTPNTQVCVHAYGDKTIVFETRGLETEGFSPLPGRIPETKVGVVFYGEKGYAVQYAYNRSEAFDLDGRPIRAFGGGEDVLHFDNFLAAVRNRDAGRLTGDIEDGHYSSALCHVGNISYRLGEKASLTEIEASLPNDVAKESHERTVEHLRKNGVDPNATPMILGPKLAIAGERFTGGRAADANQHLSREYRAPYVVPETKDL